MGCDIHLWIEGKDKKGNWFVANPRFVDYSNPTRVRDAEEYDVGRNYTLFSALANIRNDNKIPFIQESRGLPHDVTEDVRYEADNWDLDGHSFGWVSVQEMQKYFYEYKYSNDETLKYAGEVVSQLYFECFSLSQSIRDDNYNNLDIEDMRLVFWFDN